MSLTGDRVWERIFAEGDVPPTGPTAAIYDGSADRVLFALLPDATFVEGDTGTSVELWELTLGGAPQFRHLLPGGAKLAGSSFNVFADGKRVFALGGERDHRRLWQLSQAGDGSWDFVAEVGSLDFYSERVVLDEPRQRLVVFAEHQVRALSLETQLWSDLAVDVCPGQHYYFRSSLLDEANERVIFLGGECASTWVYSLANDTWTWSESRTDELIFGATVVDSKREKLLALFPGSFEKQTGNAIWQAPLDEPKLSPWTIDTRGLPLKPDAAVWDPERAAVVAFGGSDNTWVHTLAPSAVWETVKPSSIVGDGGVGAYDPEGHGVIAFGRLRTSFELARLSSKPRSSWEGLAVAPSLDNRDGYVGVYDSDSKRFVVTGGVRDRLDPERAKVMNDTWTLSLNDDPVWNQLPTSGKGPGARVNQVGGYDPVGRRLIVFGGQDYAGTQRYDDLHALSLGTEEAVWSILEVEGQHPAFDEKLSTVYDPAGRRLLFVSLPNVVALELSDTPAWHTFCDAAHAPMPVAPNKIAAALVSDGLFVSIGNASYRFDLATPYCD